MPEYLAPGVYVEEVDTGSKPIEGVSTSTAGFVGVTERGPIDVPILVTSTGEFQRWFGGELPISDFPTFRHLPHAVEGFFTNGGKRLFVVRVTEDSTSTASALLFHRSATGTPVETRLLQSAAAGDGQVYTLSAVGALSPPAQLRIGGGSSAEYRPVASVSSANRTDISLRLPLSFAHPSGTDVHTITETPNGAEVNLSAAATAGDTHITVPATFNPGVGKLITVGNSNTVGEEFLHVLAVNAGTDLPNTNVITLQAPLQLDHPADGTNRSKVGLRDVGVPAHPTTLSAGVPEQASIGFIPTADIGFYPANTLVLIGTGDTAEVRRTGTLTSVALADVADADYPAGSLVEAATPTDLGSADTALTARALAGATFLTVASRVGMSPGEVIRIGAAGDPDAEYASIADLPGTSAAAAPKPGKVILATPLRRDHPNGTHARPQGFTPLGSAALILSAAQGATALILAGGDLLGTTQKVLRIRPADGEPFRYTTMPAAAVTTLVPQTVTLSAPVLINAHAGGSEAVVREPLLTVKALDQGGWGNRLRVSIEPQTPTVVDTRIRKTNGVIDASHIRLTSMSGVEVGTVLQRYDAQGVETGKPFKVTFIDHASNFALTLDSALVPAPVPDESVRSVEFRLTVRLLKRPAPASPAREEVQAAETFPALSLDHRHSRYLHKVIGTTWNPLDPNEQDDDGNPVRLVDRRSRGESRYIRVRDKAATPAETETIRPPPEFLTDLTATGEIVPARTALFEGDDPQPPPSRFIGKDDPEPTKRTGIQSLQNEDDISIVACPGVTDQSAQQAIIDHCEFMRYRFAVLDGPRPPNDSLADVRAQRQQFDTKYAALYHPWILIPDPFPVSPAAPPDYPISPSGHMIGIYANTDETRGVHKAPANEVVRGIVGLQRSLKKGEQDLLNPFPTNINVIRDFRADNRGLRVWGARVITSDPDWKYVNVRRLFIFVEKSLDRGLQWVVFEPNAEELWARVRRSISNFLTTVWRNGALEGATIEQAFFVKCDRTTMTRDDLDNGRLVCVVGVAPVRPAEFVIVRIGLWTADAQA